MAAVGRDTGTKQYSRGIGIPTEWEVGTINRKTREWTGEGSQNIKWVSPVGSQTYGNPVVADQRLFIGTNNGRGYLARYPSSIDLGCLLAFSSEDGSFLWQHSSEKLSTGRVHDWPLQGICCAPLVDGDRLWFVTSRGEVVCLDTQGYYDGEDDGPVIGEWGKLFRESPQITAGLDTGSLSATLAAVMKSVGVTPDPRVRVTARDAGGWLASWRTEAGKAFYGIVQKGDQVQVRQLESEDDPGPGQLLVETGVDLTAGLDQGQVSSALRALLTERGMELPEDCQVQASKLGQQWTIQAQVKNAERELQLRRTGPFLTASKLITVDDQHEADTVWTFDMMGELRVSQHNMCSCSVTSWGEILFVNTSNGVDESHINLPANDAPTFLAMNKNTGKVLWTDNSPGKNILHGQWSSPSVGILGGIPQVIFGAGDGWVYSFAADQGKDGAPTLLWKFDANPKTSKWILGGRGTRNNIIATPVIHEQRVYVAVGQDPEHGEGVGHLWCVDPTKRGDVSPQLAVHVSDRSKVIPHRRLQAVDEEQGEVAIDNPNSAVIWHYDGFDQNGDGTLDFEETMHRSCGTVAIKNGLLFISDFSGLFHCLDVATGKVHWTYDMLAAAWGSPLIVEDKVYIGDEDGDVSVFRLSPEAHEPISEINMGSSVYSTPIVSHNVLYISNKSHVFAIAKP